MLVTVERRDSAPTCVYLTQLTFSNNLSGLLFHKQPSCAHLGSGLQKRWVLSACASGWGRVDVAMPGCNRSFRFILSLYCLCVWTLISAAEFTSVSGCSASCPPHPTAACFNVTAGPCCSSGILNSPVTCGRLWTISLAAVAQPRLPSAEIHRPGGPKPWKRWASSSL